MKIQRGIVKYKDRNDIVCTYALTDDGKQYYFLDETDTKRLSNGNRIATTVLVEAVDPMVKATNVGVIDQNGVIVIPFENRSIRLANDNVLIVEKAVPTSQSVIDAIELRSDPTAATQLVSTTATIKDRLKTQMGVEGNYLFNDQFSEATICDINGTNLVHGESFSFISLANNNLYLSKNTVDSPISMFSLTTYELMDSQPVDVSAQAIDVSAAVVDPSVVEGALTSDAVAVQPDVPAVPIVGAGEEESTVPTEGMVTEVPAVPVEGMAVEVPTVPVEGMAAEVPAVPVEGMAAEVPAVPVAGMAAEVPAVPVEGMAAEVPAVPVAGTETEVPSVPVEGMETSVTTDATDDMAADAPEIPADSLPTETNEVSSDDETVDEPLVPTGFVDTDPVDPSDDEISSDKDLDTAEAESDEMPVDGFDAPSEDSTDTSISDDLKAFAGGIPSDEEEVPDAEDEVPPIVEEDSVDGASSSEPAEDESKASDESDSRVEDEVSDDASEPTADAPKDDDVPQDEEDSPKEEAFSSSVTSSIDEQDEDDSFKDTDSSPVSIDAETVFKTVDKNGNGMIDSDELMVPQHRREESIPLENHSLTSLYDTPLAETPIDYGMTSSYSSPYVPAVDYGSYGSILTDVKPDRISYDSYGFAGSDNIMADVARSMSELMRQNKEQRGVITQFQGQMDSLESQNRILSEKFKDQSMRYEALSGKLRSSDEAASRLESRNQLLENRVHDLERIIASQDRELKILRPQVEGKQDLVRLLADARTLLGSSSSYDDGYYGRKVA